MQTWQGHMPRGMQLKSDGFASDLYDAERHFTLKRFCAERGIAYDDLTLPVRLETFVEYGRAFQARLVPDLEEQRVTAVKRDDDGFELRLESGSTIRARRVVLAVGITHF